MSLRWSCRWDRPEGPVAVEGGTIGPFSVKPGFHATQTVSFTVPDAGKEDRRLYLTLESIKDGEVVFVENAIYFTIGTKIRVKVDDRDGSVSYSPHGFRTATD